MTEPVSQKELPTAPESTPPRAKSRWGLWLSTLMLLLIAGGAAGAYWFGWPWLQQQWRDLKCWSARLPRAAEPGPDVAAHRQSGVDQRIQERLSSVESAATRFVCAECPSDR